MHKMKKFKVEFLLYHESFNGYDLCDGWTTHMVEARTQDSAVKKARKLVSKSYEIRSTVVVRLYGD
jgi:hypothetical protein